MVNFGRKKSSIILAIILLSTIAPFCFAAKNRISWTEEELTFMENNPVIQE